MQAPFFDPFPGQGPADNALPLAGREMEMQIVRSTLTGVVRETPGSPHALILSGDPGIGKSRLLEEICRASGEPGFRVLMGSAYESGCLFPYLPFIEALRPVLRSASLPQLRAYLGLDSEAGEQAGADLSLIGPPLVTAFSQLFPDLCRRLQVPPLQEVLSPEQEKFRLFDAVATLLERMAGQRPVLLCLDNLHWADSASLELTLYLTVRLQRSPLLLVGATRPLRTDASSAGTDAPAAAQGALKILRELMQLGLLLLLPLGPLGEQAARQHLGSLLPGQVPEPLAHALLERSGGNPFFLEELVRALSLNGQLFLHAGTWQASAPASTWELPDRVTLAVRQRLQGLACRELLQVAALFGRTFPLQALARVLAIPQEQVRDLVEEALSARIVTRVARTPASSEEADTIAGSSLHFCQGIVQEVLAEEVPIHRQRQLHAAIGRALETCYGPLARAHAAELARQYGLSDRQEASLAWNLRAGEDAVRQQAHREAIGHLRTALKLLATGVRTTESRFLPAQLCVALGESWLKLGELEHASSAFHQALEQAPPDEGLTDGRSESEGLLVRARASRLLADAYRLQGNYDLALAQLHSATALLDEESRRRAQHAEVVPEHEPALVSWLAPGQHARESAPPPEPGGRGTLLSRLQAGERLLLLQARATLDLLLLRFGEAEKTLWQTHQLAAEIGDRGSQAFALHILGWLRGWGEHIGEAIRLISQAHELSLALGDPFHAALGDQSLGVIYQALGEMEQAASYNQQGLARARRYGVQHILGWLYCNQGLMALARGLWTESEAHFQSALSEGEKPGNTRIRPLALQGLAVLHFKRGDWQSAEQLFQQATQAARQTEWYPGTLALYGHFLAVTGCTAAAQERLDLAAAQEEPAGYSGNFYLPFLVEGYLHLAPNRLPARYTRRIRSLRGFLYYGVVVDRIIGEIAAAREDWQEAEQAFEAGLALCRRSQNQPEEAAVLYEQARTALMRSRDGSGAEQARLLQRALDLCGQARNLFERYGMQRSIDQVDTLRAGLQQLGDRRQSQPKDLPLLAAPHLAHAGYQLDLRLTRRELEVLRLVAEGRTDREVADILVLSPRTVNRHLSNIFVKLDVPGRAAAVAYAIRQRLVE
jgi:DNA-binding CsgD family transcriptional regulator